MMIGAPPDDRVTRFARHGGDLTAARAAYPTAPHPWIDLSTGVNPQAWPMPALTPQSWTRLPEPSDLARLEAAAAARYGADASSVVAGPGSQALIQLLARLIRAQRVGVLGFSYSGHTEAWRAAGAQIETVERPAELLERDVGIVVNPNNPDGRLLSRPELIALGAQMARQGKTMIVDEAFMDFIAPSQSLAGAVAPGFVVLRSFGKAYGLAGLRLGFAIASPDLARQLRWALGAWPVSGPALEIGGAALADDAWLAASAARLSAEAIRLDAMLIRAGFAIIGGAPLFRLASHERAAAIFATLMSGGILTRPFLQRSDWLRFGIPGDAEQWARLEAALQL